MHDIIQTANAPVAIGPYSQAICTDALIFTAGQIGIDPDTGSLVQGGIEAETERVLMNLEAVLKAAGAALQDVVKTTVYMADLTEFTQMNAAYGRAFAANRPARSTIQAGALPKGARVEIDAVATRG